MASNRRTRRPAARPKRTVPVAQRPRADGIVDPLVSENAWRATFDAISDPIFVHDEQLRIVRANRAYAERAGKTFAELLGRPYREVFPKHSGPLPACNCCTADSEPATETIALDDGEVFLRHAYCVRDRAGAPRYWIHFLENVTGERQAREALAASESQLRTVVDTVPDILFTFRLSDYTIQFVSPAVEELVGFTPQEVIEDATLWLRQAHVDDREPMLRAIEQMIETGDDIHIDLRFWHKDGVQLRWFHARIRALRDESGAPALAFGVLTDITERKRAEQALHFTQFTVDNAVESIFWIDADARFTYVNDAVCRSLGYTRAELLALSVPDIDPVVTRERWPGQWARVKRVRSLTFETFHRRKDGKLVPVEITVNFLKFGGKEFHVAVARDIAERKRAADALTESQRAMATLLGNLQGMAYRCRNDRDWTMEFVSAGCAELTGYAPAELVGNARVSYAGLIHPDDRERVWDEVQAALAQRRQFELVYRIRTADGAEKWVGETGTGVWDGDTLVALEGFITDITARKRSETALRESAERLNRSLIQTIVAVARTIEKRDPYTAGHQQRVADIATAIATELGLAPDRIEGIRLGGIVHDIGKIYVPAEILNRPGRLTPTEFALIKSHPQIGFEIVKDIEFPWPVADMILQHHERLDGSGYPQGLTADAILLEARILAVADVIEAITSHRPYRVALGGDVAVAEIERGRGTLYDAAVVDAALAVIDKLGESFGIRR